MPEAEGPVEPGTVDGAELGRMLFGHRALLYALAWRATRSPAEADDVVQETFLRALQGWHRHRPRQVRSWLVTICLNVVRTRYRRRQFRPLEALDPSPGTGVASPQDTAEEALSRLRGAAVRAALRQLPPVQREAVVLMDLYGLTAASVGRLLGAPRGTILARVHRGHQRLRQLLDDDPVASG